MFDGSHRERWQPLAIPLGLTLVFAAIYLDLVAAVNSQGVLTGEEASVAFKDLVFLEIGEQHCRFDSNLGGHIIFWLGSHLFPDLDLFYGRVLKALLMSLVVPLGFFLWHQRLGFQWLPSALGAISLGLLPVVQAFSWMAIETGFELVLGLISLILVAGTSVASRAAGFAVLGFALITYGAAVPLLPACFATCAFPWRHHVSRDAIRTAFLASLAMVPSLLLPWMWWGSQAKGFFGGGRVDASWSRAWERVMHLAGELFRHGDSYYYFSDQAALGGVTVLTLSALGAFAAAPFWRRVWPLGLIAPSAVTMYAFTGGVIGVRRVTCLALISATFLVCLAQALRDVEARIGIRYGFLSALLALVLVAAGGSAFFDLRHAYRAREVALPIDYNFPMLSSSMPASLERLLAAPPALVRRQLWSMPHSMRVLSILHVIGRERDAPVAVDKEFIKRWRQHRAKQRNPRPLRRGRSSSPEESSKAQARGPTPTAR